MTPPSIPAGHVPLERAFSKLGLASRTEARRWILDGRVSVAGQPVTDPQWPVVPERADLRLDGRPLSLPGWRAIALHKPRGVLTSRTDPRGRPTVYGLLGGLDAHLGPVGRLDLASSGLLLLTNDTHLASWLTDPRNSVPRLYAVTVRGLLDTSQASRLQQGLVLDGERLSARSAIVRKCSRRETHLLIELCEGKNREIRRLLEALGHEVTRLKRLSFGGIELADLEPGHWRELAPGDIRAAFPGAPLRLSGVP